MRGDRDAATQANVCVFAPALLLSVTIESIEHADDEVAEIHLHPGGQGFWIARMLNQLGERPALCGPAGGEAGRALWGLMADWGIDFHPIVIDRDSASRIHDRRSGHRTEVAKAAPPMLGRHEADDLFGKVLQLSMAAGLCVVTGRLRGNGLADDIFTRLGADLAANGVRTVADLHGRDLDAWLEGGPIDVLKVSDEDLIDDGSDNLDTEQAVIGAMKELLDRGAKSVVISRGPRPALAAISGTMYRVHPPQLSVVDPSGAGDSMTGGITAGFLNRMTPIAALRLACAAGSANVARHGLATGSADLIYQLAEAVKVEEVGVL